MTGWEEIASQLRLAIARRRSDKPILTVECYPGVNEKTLLQELKSRLSPALAIDAAEPCCRPSGSTIWSLRFSVATIRSSDFSPDCHW